MPVVTLIACGKRKSDKPCKASEMYNSKRFQLSKQIAVQLGCEWYILSAKHGILSPEEEIEPYDMCLTSCSTSYKQQWAKEVVNELKQHVAGTVFVLMANSCYAELLVEKLRQCGFGVLTPFEQMDDGEISLYVEKVNHIAQLRRLYSDLYHLAEHTGGIRLFKECNGKMYWPKRGVYFIVDLSEHSLVFDGLPRIVRVGTHAVSRGSKSSLWGRLKTHKGTNNGNGNHRGSVFRLHVGNALISKFGLRCVTWGIGQNATTEVKVSECDIERMVSEYIGNLGVIALSVDDEPSPQSDRSFIERNSIAILSGLNYSFDIATRDWLGNCSPRTEIRDSMLWNIDYIKNEFSNNFFEVLERYIDCTIKNYKQEGED